MRKGAFFLCMFLVMGLSGCGPNLGFDAVEGERPADIQDKSIIYGYMDMGNTGFELNFVQYKRVKPQDEKPYKGMDVRGGLFFSATLPKGAYRASKFKVMDPPWIPVLGEAWYYNMHVDRQVGRDMRVKIKEPGIYYVGAYRLKELETGLFEEDEYSIEPMEGPDKQELLKRLKREAEGTPWVPRIQAALDAATQEKRHAEN